ncbi:amino acid ABC transporter permease (plasmid) [Skermanella rosea]|uniref:amino acid ABC transporter permease n=1 Tax=Skermanella rosea TaxID=1817965 RepID=UPI001B3B9D6B|nr:amino acid ABC transporter permease [Skermanella rosea]UEM07160.1 amino acid ABC transporter permease [Skermanella rosea]
MFEEIAPVFRELYETTGINFVFLYDPFEWERLFEGIVLSLQLIVACLTLSIIIGIIGAWAQGAQSRLLRTVVAGYIQFFRNTPPFVQLLFFFFGLGAFTPQIDAGGYYEPVISAFGWAVIALGCFGGAFNVEIFRSGIEAVPTATKEAADALGYTRLGSYIHVILPLALRICLPALNANLISLLKTTSLAYAISVPEVTYAANQIWSDNINVAEMMLVLFLYYNIVVAILAWGMHKLERRLSLPGYGR